MDTDPSFREFVPVDYDESWHLTIRKVIVVPGKIVNVVAK